MLYKATNDINNGLNYAASTCGFNKSQTCPYCLVCIAQIYCLNLFHAITYQIFFSWYTCHSALVFSQQKSLGSPSIRAPYIKEEKSICILSPGPDEQRSSITARWHGELAGEPARTPRLIVVKAKWQWGLSVVSYISSASPKIWLDSVCYPSLLIKLISHTQDLYCMSHLGYKLQALRCPLIETMTAFLSTGKTTVVFVS